MKSGLAVSKRLLSPDQVRLTISRMPLDSAARARAFSPSGLTSLARPVGQMKRGIFMDIPMTLVDVSTLATFFITLGLNQTRLSIRSFASRVQQSVAAVE